MMEYSSYILQFLQRSLIGFTALIGFSIGFKNDNSNNIYYIYSILKNRFKPIKQEENKLDITKNLKKYFSYLNDLGDIYVVRPTEYTLEYIEKSQLGIFSQKKDPNNYQNNLIKDKSELAFDYSIGEYIVGRFLATEIEKNEINKDNCIFKKESTNNIEIFKYNKQDNIKDNIIFYVSEMVIKDCFLWTGSNNIKNHLVVDSGNIKKSISIKGFINSKKTKTNQNLEHIEEDYFLNYLYKHLQKRGDEYYINKDNLINNSSSMLVSYMLTLKNLKSLDAEEISKENPNAIKDPDALKTYYSDHLNDPNNHNDLIINNYNTNFILDIVSALMINIGFSSFGIYNMINNRLYKSREYSILFNFSIEFIIYIINSIYKREFKFKEFLKKMIYSNSLCIYFEIKIGFLRFLIGINLLSIRTLTWKNFLKNLFKVINIGIGINRLMFLLKNNKFNLLIDVFDKKYESNIESYELTNTRTIS